MRKLSLLIIVVFITSMLSVSCGEYELLEHKKLCKRSADSLFKVHHDSLNTIFDSLCIKNSDAYYKQAIDSLKHTRIEDIKRLFKKN